MAGSCSRSFDLQNSPHERDAAISEILSDMQHLNTSNMAYPIHIHTLPCFPHAVSKAALVLSSSLSSEPSVTDWAFSGSDVFLSWSPKADATGTAIEGSFVVRPSMDTRASPVRDISESEFKGPLEETRLKDNNRASREDQKNMLGG